MDPGVFGMFRERNGRDLMEKVLHDAAVQTRGYLNRRNLTVEQEAVAKTYLEATYEFTKTIGSVHESAVKRMLDSYREMRARKNGQESLF